MNMKEKYTENNVETDPNHLDAPQRSWEKALVGILAALIIGGMGYFIGRKLGFTIQWSIACGCVLGLTIGLKLKGNAFVVLGDVIDRGFHPH